MATSSPLVADAANAVRRSSGRVRKPTAVYSSSPASTGKRKRTSLRDDGADLQNENEDPDSEESSSSDQDESDEEEFREQDKKARKTKATVSKPAQKKSKVNGTTSLPIRPADVKKRAPRKGKVINTQDAEDAGGLFAQVFAGDDRLEVVAANWLKSFDDHESKALADIVTFVLKCAGCDSAVTEHDIEDPDGCTNRLTDIQDEFQATAPTEYPLIAKNKAGQVFKNTVTAFFSTLIQSVAASGKLYSEPLLIDNLEVWLSTMSSAGNRAFRHTATVASLAVMTGLSEVSAERGKVAADWQHQASDLKSKKNHNRGRAKDLADRVQDATSAQEYIGAQLKDWFDAVFIHRYRDVDPAIRRDCAIALTDWIITLPVHFLDGQHLRYLGWVLSDTVAATRAEVVKQLQRLYRESDKIGSLKTFTERFRSRIVEIATTDSETNVRVAGIELLDLLRENGLLEPDDIDAVGRLIYDSDERVRKVVSAFFAENVHDLYNSKIDDLGGLESLEESLPEVAEDSFDTPRLEWLKFKSLAEMMAAYGVDDDTPAHAERGRDGGLILHAGTMESRFTLAANALLAKVDEIQDWQSLAGYLLFDHSAGRAKGAVDDTVNQLMQESTLEEREEVILLEIVSASVKHAIIDLAQQANDPKKKKLSKKEKAELTEEQEDAARHLATLIPKLLKKFGDVPSTAAAVLRMESVLNLPSMRGLRQDSVAYGALLDDIRKQFMAHGTDDVLGPASGAILHAKSYGELDELTDEKLGLLWEDVISNLAELIDPKIITVRGATETEQLVEISNNLLRITRLAQVSNCTVALEDSSTALSNNAAGTDYQGTIDYIIALIQRGLPSSGPPLDPDDAMLEDQVAAQAAEAALRFLQWKIHLITELTKDVSVKEIPYAELEALATRRDQFVNNLDAVLQARRPSDAVCVNMAECMLELHTSAVILKNIKRRPGMRDDWDVLVMDLHETFVQLILKVFSAAEKNFAILSNKKIEKASAKEVDVDINADPIDDDPLSESEEDDEDDPTQTPASQLRLETKLRKTVLAEKALCELTGKMIFAIHAGVDEGKMRERLERNRLKLGPNYKELLVYLDVGQAAKNSRSKARVKVNGNGNGKTNRVVAKAKTSFKSHAIVAEDEVEDEIDDGLENGAGAEEEEIVDGVQDEEE